MILAQNRYLISHIFIAILTWKIMVQKSDVWSWANSGHRTVARFQNEQEQLLFFFLPSEHLLQARYLSTVTLQRRKLRHRGITTLSTRNRWEGSHGARVCTRIGTTESLSTFHRMETGQNASACLRPVPVSGACDYCGEGPEGSQHGREGCRRMEGVASIWVIAVISSSIFRTGRFCLMYNANHNLGYILFSP